MLVLTRKVNERIVIDGGRIVVTVARIDGDQIRLAFEAGPEVTIDREEVHLDKSRRRNGDQPR